MHYSDERTAIRVVIADDHPIVREGLASLVAAAPGLAVVGAACNGEEAVLLARELRPDVVVMDVSMPRLDGVEATRRITSAAGCTRVLMLTASCDRAHLDAACAAGATACLLKDAPPRELIDGIRAAAGAQLVSGTSISSPSRSGGGAGASGPAR